MTSIESHRRKIREHLNEIKDAIDEGIENKPITLGFHCSSCAVEMLELFLHLENKIPFGKVIKHNWFKKPKAEQKKGALADRKVGANFPDKDEIYSLMYEVEALRDNLVYGTPDSHKIEQILIPFLKLKKILQEKIKERGLDLEKE